MGWLWDDWGFWGGDVGVMGEWGRWDSCCKMHEESGSWRRNAEIFCADRGFELEVGLSRYGVF